MTTKVFLSWSGERSKKMGIFLKDWLESIFPSTEIFFSEDIAKGSRGLDAISNALNECNIGIFLITPENKSNQWINYEAGAISKNIANSHIFTLILDDSLTPSELGPLSLFQATHITESQINKFLWSFNEALDSQKIPIGRLQGVIDKWISDLWEVWQGISKIPAESPELTNKNISKKIEKIEQTNYQILKVCRMISGHNNEISSELNRVLKTELSEKEEDVSLPHQKKTMVIGITTLPDGSIVRDSMIPGGGTFNTWEAVKVAKGMTDSEFEQYLRRRKEMKQQ